MTVDYDNRPKTTTALARRHTIQAYRIGRYVLIVAKGEKPTPGYQVDIEPSPLRIFPQQYNLLWHERPGVWPDVVVPYVSSKAVVYPEDQPSVTVHHAEGHDEVKIEPVVRDIAGFAPGDSEDEATGMSPDLSFDEAFADALANLPDREPTHPDELTTVKVTEAGGLFGGFAGFHHVYVRVSRTVS